MRRFVVALATVVAMSAAAQQPIQKKVVPQAVPLPKAGIAPVLKGAKVPLDLKRLMPAIESIERTGPSPGRDADRVFFNGDAIRVRGRNFGLPAQGYKLALRRDGRTVPMQINRNVAWSSTAIAAYIPGRQQVIAAGLGDLAGGEVEFDVVLLDGHDRVAAAMPATLYFFRNRETDDFDGDGITVDNARVGFDCNDFDSRIHSSAIEVCDDAGVDEDCDPLTFGELDVDGDNFLSAKCFNLYQGNAAGSQGIRFMEDGRRVIGGTDCNDDDATANPIRPENCPPGTPYGR